MYNQNMVDDHRKKQIIAGVLFLSIIIIVFVALKISYNTRSKVVNTPVPTPTPIRNGKLFLATKNNKTNYLMTEKINLDVVGISKNEIIAGYDIVLKYDPKKVKYIDKVNSYDLFNLILRNNEKDGTITIIGYKNISQKMNAIFNNKKLLELSFAPVSKGMTKFEFLASNGSLSDSNLINGKNQDVLGEVKNALLLIK